MSVGSKINEIITNRGIRKTFVASELGITSRSLSNKLEDKTEFTAKEIGKMVEMFRLSREEIGDIF